MSSKIVGGVVLTFSITKGRPIPRGVKKKFPFRKTYRTNQITEYSFSLRGFRAFQHTVYPNCIYLAKAKANIFAKNMLLYIQWLRQKFRMLMSTLQLLKLKKLRLKFN